MKDLEDFFDAIYKNKKWVEGIENPASLSGRGSFPEAAQSYLNFLKDFLQLNNVKSVVDFGCGDWGLYRDFDWSNIDYTGYDVSETALEIARSKSVNYPQVKFYKNSSLDLPSADLLITKDVLGHWAGVRTTAKLGDRTDLVDEFINLNYDKFSNIIIVEGVDSPVEKYIDKGLSKSKLRFFGDRKVLYIKSVNELTYEN